MDVRMITKESLQSEARENLGKGILPTPAEMVDIVHPVLGDNWKTDDVDSVFRRVSEARSLCSESVSMENVSKYGGVFHVPVPCATMSERATNGKVKLMSVSEMLKKGMFRPIDRSNARMSGNTLPVDWQNLWDAFKIDLSIRKTAMPTIRENFFNIMNMPNSSRIVDFIEFFPYAFEFVENNGEGQAVNQGETRFGQKDTATHVIYATGFTRTLLSELFDNSYDPQKVSDGIAIAYNAKRDDLSVGAILNGTYAGAAATAASTVGTLRQELLYNTLVDAIDDFGDRDDPISDRKIDVMGSVILAHPFDARHIRDVISGLPSTNERKYPALSDISAIVSYDGETIPGRVKDISYTGCTKGTAYLIKKNRYMNVGIKRGLTVEADMNPDVATLAREKRSWYFVENQMTTGLSYFVQKITLPTW